MLLPALSNRRLEPGLVRKSAVGENCFGWALFKLKKCENPEEQRLLLVKFAKTKHSEALFSEASICPALCSLVQGGEGNSNGAEAVTSTRRSSALFAINVHVDNAE
ncbi:hypothetical protein BV898_04300 [Hypsibius exemplaris]|uniref:Uncharacterized protein n=1 Tax=Hypsibius exemplaris TaxID=2072580 RepID=A0A1W0X351_HYPEX|nr:hypothetical protein BV898_04300 [Hypsibius exemplaris]